MKKQLIKKASGNNFLTKSYFDQKNALTEKRFNKKITQTEKKLDERINQTEKRLNERITLTEKSLNERINQTEKRLDEKITLTEKRLNEKIDRIFNGLIKYIDFRLEPIEEFKKDFTDFKERVLQTLDRLVAAYEKFDQEYTLAAEQTTQLGEKVENHEKRITILEKQINPNN